MTATVGAVRPDCLLAQRTLSEWQEAKRFSWAAVLNVITQVDSKTSGHPGQNKRDNNYVFQLE